MSESTDLSLLTSEELAALIEASETGSIGGIAAIEARVLHDISLSASRSAKAFGDGKTLLVSVDQPSIIAFGSAVGAGVSQTLQPQITQNSQQIKDLTDRLDKATAEIGNHETELRNIHHTLRLTGEHLQRLQRDEIMAEISQGIRAELVALITAEWSERFQLLKVQNDVLGSRCEVLEKHVEEQSRQVTTGSAEPSPAQRGRPAR